MAIEEIRRRSRRGERLDFEALHDRYFDDVSGYIARRVRDVGLAEDLTQEAFVRAYRSRRSFDPRRPVWPWLSRIARNLLINALRDERHRVSGLIALEEDQQPDAALLDDPERSYENQRLRETIETAFAELSPRARRVLAMRTIEELSYREIAGTEGVSEDAVKATLKRARRTFRLAFARLSDDGMAPALWPLRWAVDRLRRAASRVRADVLQATASPLSQVVASTMVVATVAVFLVGTGRAPHGRTPAPRAMTSRSTKTRESQFAVSHETALLHSDVVLGGADPGQLDATASGDRSKTDRRAINLDTKDPPHGTGSHRTHTYIELPCSSSGACVAIDTAIQRLP